MMLIDAEQGGGKSLLTWAIKQIIDPTKVAKSRLPKDITDLMIMAKENWLLGFDNVSFMSAEISDCFCVLLTGGGQIVRKLYTNDEAHLFNYCRPAIANGITGLSLRPDLLSRTIPLHLDCPAKENRKTEKELRKAMAEKRPSILGGLLDIVVVALRDYDEIILPSDNDMRMADCAQWLIAAESATGLPDGTLVDAIIANQDSMAAEDVETDLLAQKLIRLVSTGEFSGGIQKLFDTLQLGEEYMGKELPKNASQLSKALRRKKPNYERVGLMVDFPGRLKHGQEIQIRLEDKADTIAHINPKY